MDFDGGGAALPNTYFRPRESERSQYTEKRIGDEWTALWDTASLPDDAVVTHLTLIPYRGERAVVAYKNGQGYLPEGDLKEGESVVDALKRIALEQAGIAHARSRHLGNFTYTAGNRNPDYPFGAKVYHALYVLEVTDLADGPADESFERRIILQRDLNTILRTNHVEMRREYADALDEWLLERLKAANAGN
jgi:ADP-ribose pyrophosphatase YjhB (NUDIX family)